MIIYKKLKKILQDRNMQWKSLCDAGISVNMPAKFSKNKPMNTDIINKETYYADPCTNTLYNSAGWEMTHGFLRIAAFMLFKNIIAVENANGQLVYCSRKLKCAWQYGKISILYLYRKYIGENLWVNLKQNFTKTEMKFL